MVTTVRVREDRLHTVALRPSTGEVRLRRLSVAVAVAGLAQAVAVAVGAPAGTLPVTTTGRSGGAPVAESLIEVPLAAAAATVLALPAAAHLLAASQWGFPRYVQGLRRRDGSQRRLPALLGGPAMVGAIALRAGASDLAAVLALTASSAVAAVLPARWDGALPGGARGGWPAVAAWVASVALPWPVLVAHLAAGRPPELAAGPVALVALGTVWAVVTLFVGNVPLNSGVARRHRYNGREAMGLGLGLVASSSVAWILVATGGSP